MRNSVIIQSNRLKQLALVIVIRYIFTDPEDDETEQLYCLEIVGCMKEGG